MATLETNVFPITNLGELSTRYRLVEIAGLRSDQAEYHQNREALARRLSYSLRKPVVIIERGGVPLLVVPEEVAAVPSDVELVRTVVQLHPKDEVLNLDYAQRTPENDAIALRFLRFMIQAPLRADGRLWQASAGRPFFPRSATRSERGIDQYVGFAVRPVATGDGGLGLCLDVTTCYVGSRPLPRDLTRNGFATTWKGRNLIYRFGDAWYEIRAHALADRNVKEFCFVKDGKTWSLFEYVKAHKTRPLPSDLGNLADDAAVVLYLNSRNNELGAPAPLCYPIIPTSSEDVARQHGRAILAPHDRRALTRDFVAQHLGSLKFGSTAIRIGSEPAPARARVFSIPDLQFGNGAVLSASGTRGAINASLSDLGRQKLRLLKDRSAGFYECAPLDRQYLVLPQSVRDTFGGQFLEDLAKEVGEYLATDGGYEPIVVPYDDSGQRTFARQAVAIRQAAETKCTEPGYALVMVHRTTDRRDRDEDQLAAMVLREFHRRFDVRAAVIHSDIPRRCYREDRSASSGEVRYRCAPDQARRMGGYLRNVAITKVLLTNQRWPFVLASPLHADVTIGIDVKNNTAGLLVVGRNGSDILAETRQSRQRERLLSGQTSAYLGEVLRRDAERRGAAISSFVIHRDGRAWPSEVAGVRKVTEQLKSEGVLASDVDYAVVEISKSSPAPLRLYDLKRERPDRILVRNPLVGTAHQVTNGEAYLCTTGEPFLRQGTAHPLHLRLVDGRFPFERCIEDVHRLAALTWTQPEGCMRFPITIKLNDRILAAAASEYDADVLEFGDADGEEPTADEEVA